MNQQMKPGNYKKQKKQALAGIVASVFVVVVAGILAVTGLFFYLDASQESRASQAKETPFNPLERAGGFQDSYKTMDIVGLSYDFAVDFKETYHYYFAFDAQGYPVIVRMKGDLTPEYQALVDFLFGDESMEMPEPVHLRGVAGVIEEDIQELAIEGMNEMYQEDFLDEDNFQDYLGISLLDTTQKPMGHGDFSVAYTFLGLGLAFLLIGVFLLVLNVKNRKAAVEAEEREKQLISRMSTYVSDAPSMEEQRDLQTMIDQNPALNQGPYNQEENLEGILVQQKESKESNMFLGILGAIGGSLIGVALWLVISLVGFIAGIAGFVMLKFALLGYQKLSGRLDRKGAFISLFVAAFMVFGANVLDFVIAICKAYFQFEASFDTVRFVVMNFSSLMTEHDMWNGFVLNLVIGYGLSIWSSFSLIRSILRYKEGREG